MKSETTYIEVGDLLGIGMTIVVLVIALAFGIQIVGDIQADFKADNAATLGCNATHDGSCGVEYNATREGIEAIANIPEKLGTVVTVVIAAVLIGLLVRYLWIRYN